MSCIIQRWAMSFPIKIYNYLIDIKLKEVFVQLYHLDETLTLFLGNSKLRKKTSKRTVTNLIFTNSNICTGHRKDPLRSWFKWVESVQQLSGSLGWKNTHNNINQIIFYNICCFSNLKFVSQLAI